MKYFGIFISSFIFLTSLSSQIQFEFSTSSQKSSILEQKFSEYKVLTDEILSFKEFVDGRRSVDNFILKIEELELDVVLYPYDIRSEAYQAVIQTESGQYIAEHTPVITYRGYVNDRNKGTIRLTMNQGFLYGFIETEDDTYYLEPARYYSQNPSDVETVIYKEQALKAPGQATCGTHNEDHTDHHAANSQVMNKGSNGQCFINNMAIASDYTMYTDPTHNTIDQIINHTLGVANNTSANYELNGSNNFADGLELEVGAHFISTCETCDPWSNTLNFNAFLEEFGAWADNGFVNPFDMGQMWTDRNFSGPTVGLASQSGNLLCNSAAFHVLQDWTTNAPLLRAMTAHEIGHNLNGSHDNTAGYLMSTVVSNTNDWSPTAKASIGTQIDMQGNNCLASCQPVACSALQNIEIVDINTADFTMSWDASTAGNYKVIVLDSETGTELINMTTTNNSVVLAPPGYAICNRYEVILYNDCASSLSGSKQIRLTAPTSQGCASFRAVSQVGHTGFPIQFEDESQNATSWLWDFGDGTTSILANPSHSYAVAGEYNVSLTVNQGIHTQIKKSFLKILPDLPTPYNLNDGGDFESNPDHFAAFALEGDDALFELGLAGNALTSTDMVWKTKLNDDIGRQESDVVLLSPKFDFGSPGTYVLEFDMSMEIVFCNGPIAMQMQYSTDNGQTWTRLGSYGDSGPNISGWYNRGPGDFCPIATQVFTDQTGWTFNGSNQHKSYDVSFLAGNAGVIFRYRVNVSSIFSSGYEVDGVLIDNFVISAQKSALPLDLLSFTGELIDGDTKLDWLTESEINVDKYEVERSNNQNDFEWVGEHLAYNETANNYSFTDLDTPLGTNYYRLKMLDQDGSYRYSKTISINKEDKEARLTVFPNPVKDGLLYLNVAASDLASVELYDLAGRYINMSDTKEVDTKSIDVSKLVSGIYILSVITESGKKMTSRFSKI